MTNSFPIKHKIFRGKKWIWSPVRFELQCAYCLFLQFVSALKDKDGLVIGVSLSAEESHQEHCKQK